MFYLLDSSGFLFRAYYSLPKILDKNGNDSGAIFGFFRMLFKLLQQKPDNFIAVFDPGTKTKRQEEFKDYKKNRPPIDKTFKQQISKIIDILKRSNFCVQIVPEYEADDVIASLTEVIKPFEKVIIVSSDKDLKQLIDDNVLFLEPKKMEVFDKEKFKEIYGFLPNGMLLYLALVGDSSDNINGINGIGKKTALKIVKQFSDIDDLLLNINNLPDKIKEKILNNKDLLIRNINLVKLKYLKGFDYNLLKKESTIKNIDFDNLKNILINEYGFVSFDNIISKLKQIIYSPTETSLF